jgi:hypothetical protein
VAELPNQTKLRVSSGWISEGTHHVVHYILSFYALIVQEACVGTLELPWPPEHDGQTPKGGQRQY